MSSDVTRSAAESPATAQRGSQDEGSRISRPRMAYTVRISPCHRST
ncbi:hypothetical protein ACBR40_16160 [Nonomuraea sp. AD125B]